MWMKNEFITPELAVVTLNPILVMVPGTAPAAVNWAAV
jgi:hypothetical protein